jgi:Clr5 domain
MAPFYADEPASHLAGHGLRPACYFYQGYRAYPPAAADHLEYGLYYESLVGGYNHGPTAIFLPAHDRSRMVFFAALFQSPASRDLLLTSLAVMVDTSHHFMSPAEVHGSLGCSTPTTQPYAEPRADFPALGSEDSTLDPLYASGPVAADFQQPSLVPAPATAHQWEMWKEIIKRLYVDQNLPLPDVMKIMDEDHGFQAS